MFLGTVIVVNGGVKRVLTRQRSGCTCQGAVVLLVMWRCVEVVGLVVTHCR